MTHKDTFYNYPKVQDLSLKIQSYKLILKATNHKILLKEESVPLLIIYYKYDNNLLIYKNTIKNTILNIFNKRITEYINFNSIYDVYFILNILKVCKINIFELVNSLQDNQDNIVIRYYILSLNLEQKDLEDILLLKDNELLLYFIEKIKGCKLKDKNEIFSIHDKQSIKKLKLLK